MDSQMEFFSDEPVLVTCLVCGKSVWQTEMTHHKILCPNSGVGAYLCAFCDKLFPTCVARFNHVKNSHCLYDSCGRLEFNGPADLIKHMAQNHLEVTCEYCDRKYPKTEMFSHFETCPERKAYKCHSKLCKLAFATLEESKEHNRKIHGASRALCPVEDCDFRVTEAALISHLMSSHNNELLECCQACKEMHLITEREQHLAECSKITFESDDCTDGYPCKDFLKSQVEQIHETIEGIYFQIKGESKDPSAPDDGSEDFEVAFEASEEVKQEF